MSLILGRVLAIDWGMARLGLAISDPTRTLARPYGTLHDSDKRQQIEQILKILEAEEITHILVGLPLHLDGRDSASTLSARRYAEKLASLTPIPVALVDERLSSVEAEEKLSSQGHRLDKLREVARQKKNKGLVKDATSVDSAAASVLLQGWLDTQRFKHA